MKFKNAAFTASACLAIFLVLEMVSSTAWFLKTGSNPFSQKPEIRLEHQFLSAANWPEPQSLHPYTGFVTTYGTSPDISEYGFMNRTAPVFNPAPDTVVVGVFGGSVASGFAQTGAPVLENELKKNALFSGKKFIFLNFGVAGYKQPQQLMVLNYILALGGHLDIAVNLDGFNEIALPVAENIPNKVSPFFPRAWNLRVSGGAFDRAGLFSLGEAAFESRLRVWISKFFSFKPLVYSRTGFLVWYLLDKYLGERISGKIQKVSLASGEDRARVAVTGPSFHTSSDEELYTMLADFWTRSSMQMQKICEANGIQYFHFLQPNQYVKGSKPLSAEELKLALREEQPYRAPVVSGYPYLVRAGAMLSQNGVRFKDLTQVFEQETRTLYIDDCCHLNADGNQILAQVISKAILEGAL